MNPKISVVTVCFNAVDCIERTILSVINQTYPNVEYIIIDGGSTDRTVDIIKKYADNIAYWVSEPDNGIYDAMNKGIKAATGEWINFMNAGDSFVNHNVLRSVFPGDNVSSDYEVVYGDTICVTQYGLYYEYARPLEELINAVMPFCHQSVFVKTNTMEQRPFNLLYRITADFELFLYLYKNQARFKYCQIPIANYERISGVSAIYYIDAKKEKAQIMGRLSGYYQRLKFGVVIMVAKVRHWVRQKTQDSLPLLYKKLYLRKYAKNPYYKYLS